MWPYVHVSTWFMSAQICIFLLSSVFEYSQYWTEHDTHWIGWDVGVSMKCSSVHLDVEKMLRRWPALVLKTNVGSKKSPYIWISKHHSSLILKCQWALQQHTEFKARLLNPHAHVFTHILYYRSVRYHLCKSLHTALKDWSCKQHDNLLGFVTCTKKTKPEKTIIIKVILLNR